MKANIAHATVRKRRVLIFLAKSMCEMMNLFSLIESGAVLMIKNISGDIVGAKVVAFSCSQKRGEEVYFELDNGCVIYPTGIKFCNNIEHEEEMLNDFRINGSAFIASRLDNCGREVVTFKTTEKWEYSLSSSWYVYIGSGEKIAFILTA